MFFSAFYVSPSTLLSVVEVQMLSLLLGLL